MPRKKLFTIIGWVVVVIAVFSIWKTVKYSAIIPNPDLYQVVLLRNDQAFYGKLHGVFSPFPYLTDVYYLNAQQPALDDRGRIVEGQGKKFTVIKRGLDEIHQPTDSFYIPRENILYWENIGTDSLVARGIQADKEYRAKQAAAPASAVAPAE